MYAGPGMRFMDPNIQRGLQMVRGKKGKSGNKKLPYHSRLRVLPVSNHQATCNHSLAVHEVVTTHNGRSLDMHFAMPCVVGHKKTTKNRVHKDASKRTWK